METANRLTGTGGGPAGTSRPSALLPGLPARPSSTSLGALFAREFDEANARLQDQTARTRRLEDRFTDRRDARHESFGAARPDDGDVTAVAAPVQAAPPAEPRSFETAPALERGTGPTPSASVPGSASAPLDEGGGTATALMPEALTTASTSSSPVAATSTPAAVTPSPAPAAAAATSAPRPDVRPVEGAGTSEPARNAKTAATASTTRPGDTEAVDRAQEILRQIKLHLAPGLRRLTLDLEPAELGRLAIQLTWRPGRVNAVVRAGEPETLRLLQEREGELRAVLAERGIQADSIGFELGFDGRSPQRRSPGGSPAPDARVVALAAAAPPIPTPPTTPPLPSETLVDTYA